jgi:hypothetical protein
MMPTPRPARWLVLIAALLVAGVARGAVEFVGILTTPERSVFALADTASQKTAWVPVGKTFGDYTVLRFDSGSDTLTLRRAGAETTLHLKPDAKVKSAALELAGTITISGGEKLEVIRATLRYDQENELPLAEGAVCKITPHVLADGNIRYDLAFERENAGLPIRVRQAVVARPDQQFGIKTDEISFAFAPKSP